MKRFINNFNKLPIYLKECIAIENDDKIFNISDVFNSFDNFTYNLNKLYSKVTSRDINIDFEFWNI